MFLSLCMLHAHLTLSCDALLLARLVVCAEAERSPCLLQVSGANFTGLIKEKVRSYISWGIPMDGGKVFEFGTPKFPHQTGRFGVKPEESQLTSYSVVPFSADGIFDRQIDSADASTYRAVVQILLCPNEVTGKSAGSLFTGLLPPGHGAILENTYAWCDNGDGTVAFRSVCASSAAAKIGYAELDAAFRKVVATGRFEVRSPP